MSDLIITIQLYVPYILYPLFNDARIIIMQARYNSYPHLLHTVINISLSPFNFGYCYSYFNSISFEHISQIYHISPDHQSTMQGLLTGCVSLLGGFGAFWSSWLLGAYSRRRCLEVLACGMILACLVLQVPYMGALLLARCLQGICIGMISAVAPLFIRQLSPTQLASSLCPWNQIGIVIGITFSFCLTFLLSLFLSPEQYWRIVFALPIVTSCIQLYNLRYRFPYETPKWLMLNGRERELRELLEVIYKEEYRGEVYEELKKAMEAGQAIKQVERDSQRMSEQDLPHLRHNESSLTNRTPNTHQQQLTNLDNPTTKPLLAHPLPQIRTTNPLAKFVAYMLSISQQMVGIGPIIVYSGEIVGQILPSMGKVFPIFINSLAVFGGFLCIPVLRMFGRKRNIQYGSFINGILVLLMWQCFSRIDYSHFTTSGFTPKVFVCITLIAIRLVFSFTLGPVIWIYISQIVQPNIIPYSTMVNWLTVATINTVFPIAKHALGGNPAWIFFFFGCWTLGGAVLCGRVLIETQDKSQYEINREFDQKWDNFKLC